jgi:hypothetical protein
MEFLLREKGVSLNLSFFFYFCFVYDSKFMHTQYFMQAERNLNILSNHSYFHQTYLRWALDSIDFTSKHLRKDANLRNSSWCIPILRNYKISFQLAHLRVSLHLWWSPFLCCYMFQHNFIISLELAISLCLSRISIVIILKSTHLVGQRVSFLFFCICNDCCSFFFILHYFLMDGISKPWERLTCFISKKKNE